MNISVQPLTIDISAVSQWLEAFGKYLNSPAFYDLSLRVGVHASAVVFTTFAVIMVALLIINERPRPRTHFLWTWIVASLAFFLIRAVAVYRFGDDGKIFIFALAWWNLTISGMVALLVYTTTALARIKNGGGLPG